MKKISLFYDVDGGAASPAPAPTPAPAPSETVTSQPAPQAPTTQTEASTESSFNAGTTNNTNVTETSSQSEHKEIVAGGLKLTVDPKTGRKVVVSIPQQAPKEVATEESTVEKPVIGEPNPNVLPTQPTVQSFEVNTPGLVQPVVENNDPNRPYSADEMLLAINLGNVDESKVPEAFKSQYEAFKSSKQSMEQANKQADTQAQSEQQKAEQVEKNVKFYQRVDELATNMAKQEIGVTEEEIEASEYSDDKELIEKVKSYKAAVEFNKSRIFNDIQAETQKQQQQVESAKAEQQAVINDVISFTKQAIAEEPNFQAIDKLMLERYKQLPYEQAAAIAPAIKSLQQGTLTRQEAIVLQNYYNDTRKAYYAQTSGVGRVPVQINKPPVVEAPGTGTELPSKVDFSQLRGMNFRDKQKFISKYLNNRNK